MSQKKKKATRNQDHKVCKNCKETFFRRPTETRSEWSLRKYCTRTCQVIKDSKRRGRKDPNLTSVKLWDACTGYMVKAQETLSRQVITYSASNMSQEDLKKLIPSEK